MGQRLDTLTMFANTRRKSGGRPSVLTDEMRFLIPLARNAGMTYQGIATVLNVHSTTVRNYIMAGEAAKSQEAQQLLRAMADRKRSQNQPKCETLPDWYKPEKPFLRA